MPLRPVSDRVATESEINARLDSLCLSLTMAENTLSGESLIFASQCEILFPFDITFLSSLKFYSFKGENGRNCYLSFYEHQSMTQVYTKGWKNVFKNIYSYS